MDDDDDDDDDDDSYNTLDIGPRKVIGYMVDWLQHTC